MSFFAKIDRESNYNTDKEFISRAKVISKNIEVLDKDFMYEKKRKPLKFSVNIFGETKEGAPFIFEDAVVETVKIRFVNEKKVMKMITYNILSEDNHEGCIITSAENSIEVTLDIRYLQSRYDMFRIKPFDEDFRQWFTIEITLRTKKYLYEIDFSDTTIVNRAEGALRKCSFYTKLNGTANYEKAFVIDGEFGIIYFMLGDGDTVFSIVDEDNSRFMIEV